MILLPQGSSHNSVPGQAEHESGVDAVDQDQVEKGARGQAMGA